jgi:hypothetical protein
MTSVSHIKANIWLVTDDAGAEHRIAARDGSSEADVVAAWQQAMSPPSPVPTAADVRAEASRRMQALFEARDPEHLQIRITNASREAIRLLRIKTERAWTADEAARAAELEAADAMIEAIRAASNAMEAAPPADYADDGRWP